MGLPFYPVVFQVLMVLTFALHILMVNLTLGGSLLALYGRMASSEKYNRLGKALAKVVTVSISLAILLGVAPLLFVQVIYDPFWYASNLISPFWVIAFMFIMIAGFSLIYVYYLSKTHRPWAGLLGFLFLLAAGIIMHILNMQMLSPDRWVEWYAPGGVVDASGMGLHGFQLSRFLHFILASGAVTGLFLMLYAWYIRARTDVEEIYVTWAGRLGARLLIVFSVLEVLDGLWWLLDIPGELGFHKNVLFAIAFVAGLLFTVFLFKVVRNPLRWALPTGLLMTVVVLLMAATREALRVSYLGKVGYAITDHKLNLHWGSTLLFFLTFLLGLAVAGFLITVAFKAGRTVGTYSPSPGLMKYGTISIGLMLSWLVVVVAIGVYFTLSH